MRRLRKPSWLRVPGVRAPSVVLLIFIVLVMQALSVLGILLITQDTNRTVQLTDTEVQATVEHRIRNELYHGCLSDKLDGLVVGINRLIERQTRTLEVDATCPPTLSEKQLRKLYSQPEHNHHD